MAKAPAKKKSPLLKWVIIGGVVVGGFLFLTQPDNSPASAVAKTATKKAAPGEQAFLKVDYDAQKNPYPPLKAVLADAFRPGIMHGDTGGNFAGAGPGWTYSGMAVVDGVGQGVLVNTSTGESEILHRGESWQSLKVASIAPDYMVFNGPNGPQTVHVDTKESEKPAPASAAVGPLPGPMMAPFQMPMMGNIGSGTADQTLSIQGDTSGAGYGRGRGGRRGRGRNAGN